MFAAETLQKFAREVAKYPADQKQSAVMACLAHAQEEKGWLPPEAIEAVANYLGMPPIAAYEVASFYNMYDLKPVGKYKITVCTNLPCALSGGYHAGEYLQKKLGIGYGETTADGKVHPERGRVHGGLRRCAGVDRQ
jgi:NADH-quinone oxidoreductase subunit E